MLSIQGVAYTHPNRDVLFSDLHLVLHPQDKAALIGNNGAGKSTLLKILAGELQPSAGVVKAGARPYYVPQIFGQYNEYTIARALRIEDKLLALDNILAGEVTEANLALLAEDWTIEERCAEAFAHWQLQGIGLHQTMGSLSGGQKTKVFLAGIMIHEPDIVLLDEPSNHLDAAGRSILYESIQSTRNTLLVVSHDRTLLNLLDTVFELSQRGIAVYGGNYDFYTEQKRVESEAFQHELKSKEKALRKAKETERETMERQNKLDARGKKKQEKAGVARIMMNTLRNNAENSTSRLKDIHTEKIGAISSELNELRKEMPGRDKMKMNFDYSGLNKGKVLLMAQGVNFGYSGQLLWKAPLDFQIMSGERVVVKGRNGSGKTTLIKLMLGEIQPQSGVLDRAEFKAIYIDQDYSLINPQLTVYEQAQQFNSGCLQEHEIKVRLNRFLFGQEDWDKPCSALSGGERMRLTICCLAIGNQSPDMIILDEPTNNLDIQNIEILTAAIREYVGTLIVISHDEVFLKELGVERVVDLDGFKGVSLKHKQAIPVPLADLD